jgi:hypothetical protein
MTNIARLPDCDSLAPYEVPIAYAKRFRTLAGGSA